MDEEKELPSLASSENGEQKSEVEEIVDPAAEAPVVEPPPADEPVVEPSSTAADAPAAEEAPVEPQGKSWRKTVHDC